MLDKPSMKAARAGGNGKTPKADAIRHRAIVKAAAPVKQVTLADDGVDVTHLLGIEQLKSQSCRWPIEGEGSATLFCGHSTDGFGVYCQRHAARAYYRA